MWDLSEAWIEAMAYILEAACGCNMGKVRQNNEDNFFFDDRCLPVENTGLKKPVPAVFKLNRPICVGVFDGMGGAENGETAAFLAARTLKEKVKLLEDFVIPERHFLLDTCDAMNRAIVETSDLELMGNMGSTAVMALFSPHEVYICNLGDSKAFRYRSGLFMQLSRDHNDAKQLREQGIADRRPRLTQHLGIDPELMKLEPYVAKGDLKNGDWYLLCSDGLTDMVSNFAIVDTLHNSNTAEECVSNLIKKALENGGRDNITVIACRIRNGETG